MAGRFRKWLRRLVLLGIVLSLVVVVLGWIAPSVLKPVIERRIEEALGLRVRIGAITGNALWGLSFETVRIEGEGSSPAVKRLEVGHVKVGYDLVSRVLGSSGWLRRVQASGVILDLDLEGEFPTGSGTGGRVESGEAGRLSLPDVTLSGGRIALRRGNRVLILEDPDVCFQPGKDRAGRGHIRFARGRWQVGSEAWVVPPLSGDVHQERSALLVSDIRVAGRILEESRIRVDVEKGKAAVDAALALLGGRARIRCDLTRGHLAATVEVKGVRTGPLTPVLPGVLEGLDGVLDLNADLAGDPGRFETLKGTGRIALEATRFRGFSGISAETRVNLEAGAARFRKLKVHSREADIEGSGRVGFGGEVQGDFSCVVKALSALVRDADASPVRLTGTVAGTLAAPNLSMKGRGEKFRVAGIGIRGYGLAVEIRPHRSGGYALFADLDYESLAVKDFEHQAGSVKVSARGDLSAVEVDVSAKCRGLLLDAAARLEWPGPRRYRITLKDVAARIGESQLAARGPWTASIEAGVFRVEKSDLTLLRDPAELRGRVEKGALDLGFAVASLDLGDVFSLFGLGDLVTGTASIDLKISGSPSAPAVRGSVIVAAQRLDLSRFRLPVLRNVDLSLGLEPGGVNIKACTAEVEGGRIQAGGRVDLEGLEPREADAFLRLEDVSLEALRPWLGRPIHGRGHGRIEVKGLLSEPTLTWRFHLKGLRWSGWTRGEGILAGRYTAGLLKCEAIEVRAEGLDASGALAVPCRISLYPHDFCRIDEGHADGALTVVMTEQSPLHREVPGLGILKADVTLRGGALNLRRFECVVGEDSRLEAEGRVGLDRRFRPTELSGTVSARAFNLVYFQRFLESPLQGLAGGRITLSGPVGNPKIRADVSVMNARFKGLHAERLTLKANLDETGVKVEALDLETEAGVLACKGLLPVRLRLDSRVVQVEPHEPLALTVKASGFEPGRLLQGVDRIRKIEGPLALALDVAGTMNRPVITGTVDLEGITVKFEDENLPRLEDMKGLLRFCGERLETSGLTCFLGHEALTARGSVEYGSVSWPRPGQPFVEVKRFDLAVKGHRVLAVSTEDLRLRADVDLRCNGDATGGSLSGTIALADSWYLRDIPMGGTVSSRASFRLPMPRLDNDFGRGLALDVRLRPGRGLLIDTNVVRVRARPRLQIGGTAADPVVRGKIHLEGGRLFAPTQTFDLDRGEVELFDRDPLRPYVNVVAETNIAGIQVQVLASGPLDDLNIDLASNPSLPREDIAALIAFGSVRDNLTRANVARLVGTKGLKYLYDRFFPRQRGAKPSFFADLLDRFYIETIPAHTPVDSSSQFRAQLRILDFLYLQGSKDRFGDENLDVLFRFRFGGAKPSEGKEPGRP